MFRARPDTNALAVQHCSAGYSALRDVHAASEYALMDRVRFRDVGRDRLAKPDPLT